MASMRYVLIAATSLLVLGLPVGVAVPASASSGTSAYSNPTWWQKFETVSAPGFTPLRTPGNVPQRRGGIEHRRQQRAWPAERDIHLGQPGEPGSDRGGFERDLPAA